MQLNRFPKAVYFYYKEWQEFNMDVHRHPAIEIMYVIKGKCKVEVDNTMVELYKGDYIFIRSNVPHRLLIEKNNSCQMLNVEFEWTHSSKHFTNMQSLMKYDERLLELFIENEPYLVLKDLDYVYYNLRSLVFELNNKEPGNELIRDNLFIQLLLAVAKNRIDQKKQEVEANEYLINKIVSHIHDNYNRDLKVDYLAKVVHLNPSYLHRIFKQSIKMTINEYITKVRMEKAKVLLVRTDLSISEISDYVGFNTSQYFSNVFKKVTGLTPSKYRRYFKYSKSQKI